MFAARMEYPQSDQAEAVFKRYAGAFQVKKKEKNALADTKITG